MTERLNRYLAAAGLGSRRAVEELIRAGRVTVDGRAGELGTQVSVGMDVRVDGRPVARQAARSVLLHKPAGVVTTVSDTHGRPTVVDLVGGDVRVFPVGRLDLETTGALVLTNDGDLANRLMHPRHGVRKVYLATVRGAPTDAALDRLRRGIVLDDRPTAPADVRRVAPDRLRIAIQEGRNRQVRRMCEAIGHPVLALHRVRYASLEIDDLAPGEWRDLTEDELTTLRDA